jgi:hypothetical protein
MNTLKISSALTIAALAAATIVAVPSKAAADDRSDCQRRVEKAQDHYRKEIHEHGKHSRQADNARAMLNETWDRCWSSTHAWYDPHRHEWRTDRDWDHNYDWDHDGDDR